jgi:hypothetical protein
MRKQSTKIIIAALFVAATCMGIYGCKKDAMVVPPERAFFVGAASGNYELTTPTTVFKIPVGITSISNADRTINIAVSSSTGAVAGTHYNVPASVVIPAGEAVDTLVVTAVYNQYLAGREDVLTFTVSGDGVPAALFNKTFTLNVKGPCFEGDIEITDLEGDYENTMDVTFNYGPYTTTVKNATSTGPTSATLTISNIYDFGWNDINVDIDWSDPANPKVSFVEQLTGYDAGNENPAYAGEEISIAPPPGGASMGSYSWCNGTITLYYRLGIPSLGGYFGTIIETKLER